MDDTHSNTARQLAQAASDFERQVTGRAPNTVTVVLSDHTLVITLHGSLTPAEMAVIQNSKGAAQVKEFYRQLFTNASHSLREEIKRITGVEISEATAEVDMSTGTIVKVFTTGAVVQVFLLARSMPAETWSGSVPIEQS